eukprot:6780768-Prymnesium_polylepis.1
MFKGQCVSSELGGEASVIRDGSEMVKIRSQKVAQPPDWDAAVLGVPPPPPPPAVLPPASLAHARKPPPPSHPKPRPPSHPKPAAGPPAYSGAIHRLKGWGARRKVATTRSSISEYSESARPESARPESVVDESLRVGSVRSSRRYSEVTDATDAGGAIDYGAVYTSRFAIACLAVALLWSTTLTGVTATLRSSNALRIPQVSVVVLEGVRFYNETVRLHDYYVGCIGEALSVCNATLNREFEAEARRAEAAQQHNQRAKTDSRDAQASCASSHAMAIASVTAWQAAVSANGGATPDVVRPLAPRASPLPAAAPCAHQPACHSARSDQQLRTSANQRARRILP